MSARNPKLAKAIQDRHEGARVPALLAKPDGSTMQLPAPRTTSQVLQEILDAAQEATEVGELGFSKATADELMARPVPAPRINPDDPLGLNPEPEPEQVDRPGDVQCIECNCGAGDCCPERDDPGKVLKGVNFRRLEDVQAESVDADRAAVRAIADALGRLEGQPKEPVLGVPPASLLVTRPSRWQRFVRAVNPLRGKAARGVTERQKEKTA